MTASSANLLSKEITDARKGGVSFAGRELRQEFCYGRR